MKVLPLTFIWCVSFIVMTITFQDFGAAFWVAFMAFAIVCVYMGRHYKRLETEIDEIFGK